MQLFKTTADPCRHHYRRRCWLLQVETCAIWVWLWAAVADAGTAATDDADGAAAAATDAG